VTGITQIKIRIPLPITEARVLRVWQTIHFRRSLLVLKKLLPGTDNADFRSDDTLSIHRYATLFRNSANKRGHLSTKEE
jgi:hypothetical protein